MSNSRQENPAAPFTQEAFLKNKQLDVNLFDRDDLPSVSAPLAEHSAFIFKHILSRPYAQKMDTQDNEIARYHHGIQHANRVASLIPVWANLFKRHEHLLPDTANSASSSSDSDFDGDSCVEMDMSGMQAQMKSILSQPISPLALKLLQIAALFHDTGREGDDKDLWENDSATLCYLYMRKLGIEKETALFFADVVANKDSNPEKAQQLLITADEELSWHTAQTEGFSLYHILLHDADCLDIIRARDHFEADHLYFDRVFFGSANVAALNDMAELITEMRSWIATQGDDRVLSNATTKLQYEHADGYHAVLASMDKTKYKTLATLFNGGKLLSADAARALPLVKHPPFDATKGLEINNLYAAMREGKLFARGLVVPSGQSAKKITYADGHTERETLVGLELRKLARRKGVATTTSKGDGTKKDGNPHRSVTMLAYGAAPFSDTGFLLLDLPHTSITATAPEDFDTGHQKKQHMDSLRKNTRIAEEITFLVNHLKRGGSSRRYDDFAARHNELTCHLHEKFDAIYYSTEPTLRNYTDLGNPEPIHPDAPLLKAIYLQREYEKKFGVTLPIFEYSGTHNDIRKVTQEECTNERIKVMWQAMVNACINRLIKTHDGLVLISKNNPELIKVNAIYGINELKHTATLVDELLSADNNYSKELKESITNIVKNAYKKVEHCVGLFEMLILTAQTDNLALFTDLVAALPLQSLAENEQYLLMLTLMKNKSKEILSWVLAHDKDKSIINAMNEDGAYPLLYAIEKNDLALVEQLLTHGANCNLENQHGTTPLLAAINTNQPDIVSALLKANVDVNKKNAFYSTPLGCAINNENKKMVKILLKNGANANTPIDKKPITPLMLAALNSQTKILSHLLKHGAVVDSHAQISIQNLLKMEPENKAELLRFSLPGSTHVILTPLQGAMLQKNSLNILLGKKAPECVLLLFKANAALIITKDGKTALSTDYLPGNASIGQLITKRFIEDPLVINQYFAGLDYCLDHITDEKSIQNMADNEELIEQLIKHGKLALLARIAEKQYELSHTPLRCAAELPINALMQNNNRAIFAVINSGALTLLPSERDDDERNNSDESKHDDRMQYAEYNPNYSRYISVTPETEQLTDDNQPPCDYSAFNFNGIHFVNQPFINSHWRILQTDYLLFSDCKLDGFSVTPDSNLTHVKFKNPIFSNPEEARKVAALFPTIPLFLFENRYTNEVKTLKESGMKIRVDKQFRERLQQMIKKNEYEIFALIISLLPASKLVKLLTNLLQEAMTQPGRAAFADVILKTGQINITDLTAKQVRLNQHVQRLETQMEHLGDGKKARCKKTSIQEQLRFFKQKQEGSPSVLVEAAKSYKPR